MKLRSIKLLITIAFAAGAVFAAFLVVPDTSSQKLPPSPKPTPAPETVSEIAGYRSWRVASKMGFKMDETTSMACIIPMTAVATPGSDIEASPHKDHFLKVYVNSVGVGEMLHKKKPKFPVGTVIVKEKLATPDGTAPELLTVMIKREKGYNSKLGNWEFMTVSGDGTEITARGKLESCQNCHADYPKNDFVTRVYLDESFKKGLR